MKKTIISLTVLILFVSNLHGMRGDENPTLCPSLGWHYDAEKGSMTYKTVENPAHYLNYQREMQRAALTAKLSFLIKEAALLCSKFEGDDVVNTMLLAMDLLHKELCLCKMYYEMETLNSVRWRLVWCYEQEKEPKVCPVPYSPKSVTDPRVDKGLNMRLKKDKDAESVEEMDLRCLETLSDSDTE